MSDQPEPDPVLLLEYISEPRRVDDDLLLEVRRRVIDRNQVVIGLSALQAVVDLRKSKQG